MMKRITLGILIIVITHITVLTQFAEPAVTGANFVPNEIDQGTTSTLTVSFSNSGSTPIPAGSIEITINTAFNYYTTDGTTPPGGMGGALFSWVYLGVDIWRGTNIADVPAFGGGPVIVTVTGNAVSPGFETTNINVQPVNTFLAFTDSPNNNNIQPDLKINPPVSQSPIARNDYVSIEGSRSFEPIMVDVQDNDINPNGDNLITRVIGTSTQGVTAMAMNGDMISYIAPNGFIGFDTIMYEVCDVPLDINEPARCDTALVIIDMSELVVIQNTCPDQGIDINTILDEQIPAGMLLVWSKDSDGSDGLDNVLPSPHNFSDTLFVYYYDFTSFCYGPPTPIVLDIRSCNANPPIAINDIAVTLVNVPVTAHVLTNDIDPDGDNLIVLTTPLNPTGGTVTIDHSGEYTFIPSPGFEGEGSFSYVVCDDGDPVLCDTAEVIIQVIDNNDPNNNPPLGIDDNFLMENDNPLIANILSNDSDPDGDNLIINTSPTDDTDFGNLTIFSDGSFIYIPNSGFVGTDRFTYQICDDGSPVKCDLVDVTIEVLEGDGQNDTYATDDVSIGHEGEDQTGDVTDNDYDPENHQVRVTRLSNPMNGTLSLNLNGTYNYEPNQGFTGNDQFVYQICDNGSPIACDIATVYIAVLEIQEPPLVLPNPLTISQNMVGTVCMPILDLDEGDTFTAQICNGSPAHGIATPTVNGSELCITYRPISNYSGADEICVIVCDQTGLCDTTLIPVTVVPPLPPSVIPEPPVVIITPITLPQDSTVEVCTVILDANVGDTFTATLCAGSPENGMATPVIINNQLCIEYTPDIGYKGTDEICVIVCDQTGRCDIVMIPVTIIPSLKPIDIPQPPVVIVPPLVVPEDSTASICAPIVDPNIGDMHTVTACGGPEHGVALVTIDNENNKICIQYTPEPNYSGSDNICLIVCDQTNLCHIVMIPIEVADEPEPNMPPIAINDINSTVVNTSVLGNVLTNDSDPENDNLVVSITPINPSGGVVFINNNGNYTFVPSNGFVGEASFSYVVCDNGVPVLCDTAEVVIVVMESDDPDNNPPIGIPDNIVTENGHPVTGNLLSNDSDPDGDNLTIVTTPVDDTDHGDLTINADGTFTYEPDPGFVGVDIFFYQVCDDGSPIKCDVVKVTIEVLPNDGVNSVYATDDAALTAANTMVNGNVIINDNDPEKGILTVTKMTDPAHGTLVLNTNGNYTYMPDMGFEGNDQFVYRVCDNGVPQACDIATVYITVISSNIICLDINAKVFLEGALIEPNGLIQYFSEMRTDLNDLRLLPGQAYANPFLNTIEYRPAGQPYDMRPWLYNGNEGFGFDSRRILANGEANYPSSVVDWVLVTLRTAPTDEDEDIACQKAALLYKDGTIEVVSPCCNMDKRLDYYIAVEHRNHLLVMSNTQLSVDKSGGITHDFTTQNSYQSIDPNFNISVGFGQKEVSNGVWAMFAGNAEQKFTQDDTDITVDDEVIWGDQNSNIATYQFGDFNLNGDVNFNDRITWELNNGKFSSVPRRKNQ